MSNLYVEADGKTYLHYDNWSNFRDKFQWENPRQRGHFRVDIELKKVETHSHHISASMISSTDWRITPVVELSSLVTFWYACDEWTTINVHDGLTHPSGSDSMRLILESNHHDSQNERVILYSTFCTVYAEPWGRSTPVVHAFFRGKMWAVSAMHWMLGHEWRGGLQYPLTTRTYGGRSWSSGSPGNYSSDDYLPETFSSEPVHPDIAGFLEAIYDCPQDQTNWLVLADYLEEKDDPLGTLIREKIDITNNLIIKRNPFRPSNYRTLTAIIARYFNKLNIQHPEDQEHNLWLDRSAFPNNTKLVAG